MVSLPSVRDYRCFAGGSDSDASFTATWTPDARILSRAVTFAQSPTGVAAFRRELQATGVAPAQTLIVLAATGSYGVALAVTLHEAGYAVAVVNPAHLHNSAQ